MLADHFTSPVFTAALELWVAARTEPALLASVAPLELRVGREVHRLTVELLGADESGAGVRELVQAPFHARNPFPRVVSSRTLPPVPRRPRSVTTSERCA